MEPQYCRPSLHLHCLTPVRDTEDTTRLTWHGWTRPAPPPPSTSSNSHPSHLTPPHPTPARPNSSHLSLSSARPSSARVSGCCMRDVETLCTWLPLTELSYSYTQAGGYNGSDAFASFRLIQYTPFLVYTEYGAGQYAEPVF